jgi:hypothetical protein
VKQVLSSTQQSALRTLATVVDATTYLAGGVAVGLHLRHRRSNDLDLFAPEVDAETLVSAASASQLGVLSRAEGTVYLDVGGVPASVLRYSFCWRRPCASPTFLSRSRPRTISRA